MSGLLEADGKEECAGGSVGCEACPLCSEVAAMLWFNTNGTGALPG